MLETFVESKTKVLVVDDQPLSQRVAVVLLRHLHLTAEVASGGSMALSKLSEDTFSLVLLDINMPGMDGVQLTRAIRQLLPPERQPRIIGMTSIQSAEQRQELLDAGMDAILGKPIDIECMREALREAGIEE